MKTFPISVLEEELRQKGDLATDPTSPYFPAIAEGAYKEMVKPI